MEIHLKNIGIVKDSSVALDGLTIITGANNSGKSTVGKALYSILEGAKNAPETYSKDRFLFAASRLQTIHRELNSSIFLGLSSSAEAKINSILEELDTVVESAKSNDYQHCIKIAKDIQISLRQLINSV